MEVTFSFQAKTLVVHLIGELDEHAAEYARRAIDNAIEGKSQISELLSFGIYFGNTISTERIITNYSFQVTNSPPCLVDKNAVHCKNPEK